MIENGAQSNVIGTNGDGKGDDAERNVISANAYQGVYIGGAGTNLNVVAGNLIGVDETGTTAMGNGNNGVWIADGASRTGSASTPETWRGGRAERDWGNSFSGVAISDPGNRLQRGVRELHRH